MLRRGATSKVGYPDTALVEPATVAAHGAKVLNLHQGVDGMLNPYINYPFDAKATARLASYTARAHGAGLKVCALPPPPIMRTAARRCRRPHS